MPDDARPLHLGAHHEARDVGQVDERNVEGVAEPDEPGGLVGGVHEEDASLDLGLVGDDAHRAAAEPRQADDDLGGEEPLQLEPRAGVDHPVDHLVHVEVLPLIVGHDLVDRAPSLGLRCLDDGRPLPEVLRQVGQVALGRLDGLLVGGGEDVPEP